MEEKVHETTVFVYRDEANFDRWEHATPKPVIMIARCIASSCPKDGLVYEPFLGTGSTMVACEDGFTHAKSDTAEITKHEKRIIKALNRDARDWKDGYRH